MKLICIVGRKRSGKDTVADYILKKDNSVKYQLAGPIKEALTYAWANAPVEFAQTLRLNADNWEGIDYDRETHLVINNKDASMILRKAINYLNAYLGFDYDSDHSAVVNIVNKHVLNNIEPWSCRRLMQTLGTDIIVNEFDSMYWVKLFAKDYLDNIKKDYYVVPDIRQVHEIECLRAMGATIVHVVRPEQVYEDSHITEQGLPVGDNDLVIENTGSLEELYEKINRIL